MYINVCRINVNLNFLINVWNCYLLVLMVVVILILVYMNFCKFFESLESLYWSIICFYGMGDSFYFFYVMFVCSYGKVIWS